MDKNQSVKSKVASEKAASQKELKMRVASAWTLAKTMLPSAPEAVQFKFAHSLLNNSTRALKAALRQTAINAHHTRVAESFKSVHKLDLNDLLEDPSILNKEKGKVESELKSDAKSAAKKKADDRKQCGPLPTEYPEPKRDEPKELDGQNAADRPKELIGEGAAKEANKKKAHGKDCKGCSDCDGEKKKEASTKVAEEEAPKSEEKAEEKPAEEADKTEGEADKAVEDADAALDEASEVPAEAPADDEAPAGDEAPAEEFDEEKANLEDAVEDLKSDIDGLEDAIAEFTKDPDDMSIMEDAGIEGEGTEGDEFNVGGDDFNMGGEEPIGGEPTGEELNLDDIFNEDNMTDKVSALNDEDEHNTVEIAIGEDDFFKPSDPAELEGVLEQEEDLTSPADMFAVEGVDDDPLARIFASSSKEASEGIVEPGNVADFFSTELKGDTRNAEADHDGDIFADVFDSIKQPTREDQRDTEANLEAPKQATIRNIRQTASLPKEASTTNLAKLLFNDDDEF